MKASLWLLPLASLDPWKTLGNKVIYNVYYEYSYYITVLYPQGVLVSSLPLTYVWFLNLSLNNFKLKYISFKVFFYCYHLLRLEIINFILKSSLTIYTIILMVRIKKCFFVLLGFDISLFHLYLCIFHHKDKFLRTPCIVVYHWT